MNKCFKKFGDYKVVDWGISCLVRNANGHMWHYDISKSSLLSMKWVEHMRPKIWVNMDDFVNAYDYALNKFFGRSIYD